MWCRAASRAVLAALALPSGAAVADEPTWTTTEISSGAESVGRSWSTYLTVTHAPWSGTAADGIRFRSTASYGRSWYDGTVRIGRTTKSARHMDQRAMSEGLAGAQLTFGPVVLKAFAGLSADSEWDSTSAPATLTTTKRLSFKGVLEAWWTLTPDIYAQADLQWRAITDGAQGRLRLGQRLPVSGLSAGLEAGGSAGATYETAKGGGFVRYEFNDGEVSVSGGLGGERAHPHDPYATAGLLLRF